MAHGPGRVWVSTGIGSTEDLGFEKLKTQSTCYIWVITGSIKESIVHFE